MRFFLSFFPWVVWLAALAVVRAAEAPVATLPELQSFLAARLAATRAPGAAWGMEVVSLGSGKVLFATNANRLLVPASNTKLFTGAVALDRLGPELRVATRLLASGPVDASGRLEGDLWVRGEGDPQPSGRQQGGGWKRRIEPLVSALKALGIKRIEGGLVADTSAFRGPAYGSGWNWDDLSSSDAPAISSLTFDRNCVRVSVTPGSAVGQLADLRVDPPWAGLPSAAGDPPVLRLGNRVTTVETNRETRLHWEMVPGAARLLVSGSIAREGGVEVAEIPVPSPAAYFLRALREGLASEGIEVKGRSQIPSEETDPVLKPGMPEGLRELASIPSAPVSMRVREMMKPSDNLQAQLLLLTVGARSPSALAAGVDTSEIAGVRVLESFLTGIGIRRTEFFFEEGSGLSRKNAATPHAIVQLLVHMSKHRAAREWMDSLPIGGVDGSLKGRFTAGPLKGNVRAKTGSLQHVAALSGYVHTASGDPLAFSILVNEFVVEGSGSARREIDALVEALGTYTGTL
jgi:D-alanyl-D-alanine carboxypeptidase/D-alanyl-D-alanine-endopeptidase (penicillin-binding protein 4)